MSQHGDYEAFWGLVFACKILKEEVENDSLAVQHALCQLLLQDFGQFPEEMVVLEVEASRIPDVLVHACQTLVYGILANELVAPNFTHIEEVFFHIGKSFFDDLVHGVQFFVTKN